MSKVMQVIRSVGRFLWKSLENSPTVWMMMGPVPYRFPDQSDDE